MSGVVGSEDLPAGRRHLRIAMFLVGVFVVLCAALDVWVINRMADLARGNAGETHVAYYGSVRSILENLIASALAVFMLGLTYRKVVAWIDPADRVVEVPAAQITDRLLKNARKSQNYVFIGNTATFVSTAILPILADSARTESRSRSIDLYVIDPIDQQTVRSYKNYSDAVAYQTNKVADATLAIWLKPTNEVKTQEESDVQGKVLATIYLTAFAISTQGLLGSIYLRRAFTPFRADLSDAEVVLTQESNAEAAVGFSSNGHFYSWYRKECDALRSQCTHLDVTKFRDDLRLVVVHPLAPKLEVMEGLKRMIAIFPHLSPLLTNGPALESAVSRISRPRHSYQNK